MWHFVVVASRNLRQSLHKAATVVPRFMGFETAPPSQPFLDLLLRLAATITSPNALRICSCEE